MKFNIFELSDKNEELQAQLPDFFAKWDKEVSNAESIFKLDGERLELIARNIPHHQVYYSQLALEARAVLKWLENQKGRAESKYIKNYNNAPRALGVKEQSIYLQGEKEIVELNQLIIQAELSRGYLDEIVEAIKQMSWSVANIVKLRVAEMSEAVI